MKHCKSFFLIAFPVTILFSLSYVSAGDSAGRTKTPAAALLPMSDGWYKYDFERTFKGIEDEYNFALSTGMKMVQELTWRYTGVVCRFEDGVLYDPVTGIELSIDGNGRIGSAGNVSVRGTLRNDGGFFWSGLKEEHGRMNSIFVKGTLTSLPPSVRGGREFDGVYRLTDTGTGRQMLANISDGFYTWRYIDGEEAGFTPWPTLVRPDGSFSFSMDLTTVMEMGNSSSANYSTGFISEGKVIPGRGITLEEISRSTGMGLDQGGAPQIYGGTMIRSGEIPNEAVPADIETTVRAGRAAVRAEPKPNPVQYPSWYLRPPVKPGFIYASGEKTFDDRQTAFAMAEAAAAAGIAEQIRMYIESSVVDITDATGTRVDERIRTEALNRLNYRVIERHYNEETRTAFVLAEQALNR